MSEEKDAQINELKNKIEGNGPPQMNGLLSGANSLENSADHIPEQQTVDNMLECIRILTKFR